MSGSLILDMNSEVSGHLAVAIRMYRNLCTQQGQRVPPTLREIEQAMAQRAMRGHEGSSLDQSPRAGNPHVVNRKLLSYAEAARAMSCSVSTVKRRIAAGELAAVRDGRCARIRAVDLDSYIENLGA